MADDATSAQQALVQEAVRIAASRTSPDMSPDEKDMILELAMTQLLDQSVAIPFFGRVAKLASGASDKSRGRYLMHTDPRLPTMPGKPTLIDFFKYRIMLRGGGGGHLLQSARLAMKKGLPDKLVLACLLHDIAVSVYLRTDHGYHSAQLIEPYVDAETAFAVRYHQALRFYPDDSVGYEYPDMYRRAFGDDYVPQPYVQRAYDYARNHKWYMSARLVTTNDLYSFDPSLVVEVEEFTDVIGRTFKQPEAGLGFDDSPVAHMWRSIIWPNNFL